MSQTSDQVVAFRDSWQHQAVIVAADLSLCICKSALHVQVYGGLMYMDFSK